MKNLERVALIATFYEHNRQRGPTPVKNYLREAGLTLIEAKIVAQALRYEITKIQDQQDEQNLVNTTDDGTNVRHHVELIVSQDFVKKVSANGTQGVLDDPLGVLQNLTMVSNIAYKYQLKYSLIILEMMIDDDDIWEQVTIH